MMHCVLSFKSDCNFPLSFASLALKRASSSHCSCFHWVRYTWLETWNRRGDPREHGMPKWYYVGFSCIHSEFPHLLVPKSLIQLCPSFPETTSSTQIFLHSPFVTPSSPFVKWGNALALSTGRTAKMGVGCMKLPTVASHLLDIIQPRAFLQSNSVGSFSLAVSTFQEGN